MKTRFPQDLPLLFATRNELTKTIEMQFRPTLTPSSTHFFALSPNFHPLTVLLSRPLETLFAPSSLALHGTSSTVFSEF